MVVKVLMGWEDMVESRDDGNVGWYPASPVASSKCLRTFGVNSSCPTPPGIQYLTDLTMHASHNFKMGTGMRMQWKEHTQPVLRL